MNINEPYLFISINEEEIYFFSIKFSEGLHYKILDSTFVKSIYTNEAQIIRRNPFNRHEKIICFNVLDIIDKKRSDIYL